MTFLYKDKNKIIIHNEDKYKLIKDIIFIKEIEDLDKSIFSINYDKLSESKQNLLDDKYTCNICTIIIKNEKPYLCYKCQKIFHEECLIEWENKCQLQNKNLECPYCRNKSPIENWNKKLDYEDNKLDNLDNLKEELTIYKPKRYQELQRYLDNKIELYEIFIYDNNNNKIIKINEDKYKLIKDIIFIKEINKDDLGKSMFSINYNKFSETKKEKLEEKYTCNTCTNLIKNEKPFLCYKCQKIFHEKCLKDWDNECKLQNKILECPNCRNKLSIEKWNKKLDYEDNRIDNANLLNTINEYKLSNNLNYYINIIKDKKL